MCVSVGGKMLVVIFHRKKSNSPFASFLTDAHTDTNMGNWLKCRRKHVSRECNNLTDCLLYSARAKRNEKCFFFSYLLDRADPDLWLRSHFFWLIHIWACHTLVIRLEFIYKNYLLWPCAQCDLLSKKMVFPIVVFMRVCLSVRASKIGLFNLCWTHSILT